MGGRLAPAVSGSTAAADAAAAAAVVAAAGVLLRGHVLRVHAVAPVAARAGARGRGVGVALHGVGLAWDARQRHVAEAQTQALRVKGLDLAGLPLQEGADSFGALVLQGQHLFLDLGKERERAHMKTVSFIFKLIIVLKYFPIHNHAGGVVCSCDIKALQKS